MYNYVSRGRKPYTCIPTLTIDPAIPVLESVTENGTDENFGAKIVNMPVERPDGDLYVAILVMHGDNNVSNLPPNWVLSAESTGFNYIQTKVYSWTGDSEPATYGFDISGDRVNTVILRFSGENGVSFDAGSSIALDTNESTLIAPSVVASRSQALVVRHYSFTAFQSFVPPVGLTEIASNDGDASMRAYTEDSPSFLDVGEAIGTGLDIGVPRTATTIVVAGAFV